MQNFLPARTIAELAVEAVKVLEAIETISDVKFDIMTADFGGAAYFKHGTAFPDETKQNRIFQRQS